MLFLRRFLTPPSTPSPLYWRGGSCQQLGRTDSSRSGASTMEGNTPCFPARVETRCSHCTQIFHALHALYSVLGKSGIVLALRNHASFESTWKPMQRTIRRLLRSYDAHRGSISSLTWISHLRFLASSSLDHTLAVWNFKGECVARRKFGCALYSSGYSAKHDFLVVGTFHVLPSVRTELRCFVLVLPSAV